MTNTLELLTSHPFLAGLPPGWVEHLAGQVRQVGYPAGFRIFREGGPAEHFWLIDSGRVAIDVHIPGRGDVLIETLPAGAVLGWSWLSPPYRWHFGAVAVELTHTVQFDAAGVTRLCDLSPELGSELRRRFIAVLADRLQATRVRLLDLYTHPVVPA
ncbi:MAG TPA: cyclic nucleotide-binding domain-containing protein [Micromonosporaceae bacterium]|nr:cyclic nucleotide-binding domain-containing protein [Micromonosporaceae bacterium]